MVFLLNRNNPKDTLLIKTSIKVATNYKNFYIVLIAAMDPFMGESDLHLATFLIVFKVIYT